MTITFPTALKISSTSSVSLNSRFTQMMDKRSKTVPKSVERKAVFDSDYEDVDEQIDVKQERNVHYGTHDENSRKRYRKFNRLRGRIGRPNSERKREPQRHSYWDDREERYRRDDRRRGNYGYEWDKTFKRTDPRQWKRSRRDRYKRGNNDGGHPLDPLKYHQEDRTVHFNRHRGGNYNNRHNFRNHRHQRYSYRRNYRRNNNQQQHRRSPERNERRSLDNDLDSYFSTSERHSRKRLDTDLDGYMDKSKKGLDRTIDQYMSATKKTVKSVIKKAENRISQ